jgi:hypothetical protein
MLDLEVNRQAAGFVEAEHPGTPLGLYYWCGRLTQLLEMVNTCEPAWTTAHRTSLPAQLRWPKSAPPLPDQLGDRLVVLSSQHSSAACAGSYR